MRGRRLVATGLAVAVSVVSSPSVAQTEGPGWALGAPEGEVLVGVVSVLSLSAVWLPQARRAWGPTGARPFDPVTDDASDVSGAYVGTLLAMGAGAVLEGAYYADAGAEAPAARAVRTTMVDAEAVLLSTGVTMAVKRLAGRCRPRAFHAGRCLDADREHTAFPSGHTSSVAAVAGTRLWIAGATTPSGYRVASFAAAELLTVNAAVLRVLAGAHSVEDVVAGWLVGHAVGLAVAAVHPIEGVASTESPAAPSESAASFSWNAAF